MSWRGGESGHARGDAGAGQRPQARARSRDARGVFLTGGNQLRLSSTIGGTPPGRGDRASASAQGAVIAGTWAGASAMASHMVAFGAAGATPRQRMAQIAAGLGLLPGVIIDQHFQQRNRLGRLLAIIAQNPSLLGLGIDEDTAGVVGPDHVLEVIGRRSVTIVDGASLRNRCLGGPRPPAGDDHQRRAAFAAGRLSLRPRTPRTRRRAGAARARRLASAPADDRQRRATPPKPAAPRNRAPAASRGRRPPLLRILDTRVLRGPNIWAHAPAIVMLVDLGMLEDWPTDRSRVSPRR